jgi:hypothetical protein
VGTIVGAHEQVDVRVIFVDGPGSAGDIDMAIVRDQRICGVP